MVDGLSIMNAEKLSDDVLLNILSYLSPYELCRTCHTSKFWFKLTENNYLWSQLCKRDFHLDISKEPSHFNASIWKDVYKLYAVIPFSPTFNTNVKISKSGTLLTCKTDYCETVISMRGFDLTQEYYWEIKLVDTPSWLCTGIIVSKERDIHKIGPSRMLKRDWIGNRKGEYAISNDMQIYDNGKFITRGTQPCLKGKDVISLVLRERRLFCFTNGRPVVWFRIKQHEDEKVYPAITLFKHCVISTAQPFKYKQEIYRKYGDQMSSKKLQESFHSANRLVPVPEDTQNRSESCCVQ